MINKPLPTVIITVSNCLHQTETYSECQNCSNVWDFFIIIDISHELERLLESTIYCWKGLHHGFLTVYNTSNLVKYSTCYRVKYLEYTFEQFCTRPITGGCF